MAIIVSISPRTSDKGCMIGYTVEQIGAVTEALQLTTQAVEKILQVDLPLSMSVVQETQGHLFRARACLAAIIIANGSKTLVALGRRPGMK